jgi:hypothetical protein
MQNALLGELFERTTEMRKPGNPNVVVIDLDKCNEIEAKLEEQRKKGQTFDTEAGLASIGPSNGSASRQWAVPVPAAAGYIPNR